MLFQQFPFCSSAESAKFNDSSEDEVFTAIMHLADEEALDLLMGLGLGRVTTEWRLSEYERELRGLKTYLAAPSGLTPAEHKVLLMLEADGSLAACESALRKLRLPSGLPKGLHKAIEDFGEAVQDIDEQQSNWAEQNRKALLKKPDHCSFSARQACDLAKTLTEGASSALSDGQLQTGMITFPRSTPKEGVAGRNSSPYVEA